MGAKAKGGKSLYGARIGILMLEAWFPRVPGDVGNGETWPFPVLYKGVRGASPHRVVRERAAGLLDDFLAAAADLVEAGEALVRRHPEVGAIAFECANMAPYSRRVAEATGRPVFDAVNFITWFHGGLRPRVFPPP